MLVLMVGTVLLPYFITGPMAPEELPYMGTCRESWWKNLLYVNNYVTDKKVKCFITTVPQYNTYHNPLLTSGFVSAVLFLQLDQQFSHFSIFIFISVYGLDVVSCGRHAVLYTESPYSVASVLVSLLPFLFPFYCYISLPFNGSLWRENKD